MDQEWIKEVIRKLLVTLPENSMEGMGGEKVWEEALLGFLSGADPIYEKYKEYVGEFHFTPTEIFNLTFPETSAFPEELSVISWVLPQRLETKQDNQTQNFYPADLVILELINRSIPVRPNIKIYVVLTSEREVIFGLRLIE